MEQVHWVKHLEQPTDPPGTVRAHLRFCRGSIVVRHGREGRAGWAGPRFQVQVRVDRFPGCAYLSDGLTTGNFLAHLNQRGLVEVRV